MYKLTLTTTVALLSLSACTNTDNPQLAMCQAVTKQLTSNSVASWGDNSNSDGHNKVTVNLAYTNANGQAGSMKCDYKKHQDGTIDTAPTSVVMNNEKVDSKVLLQAGTQASKELLAGTYKNTVEKTNELAGEAVEKATEVAGQAKEAALEGAKALQELQK